MNARKPINDRLSTLRLFSASILLMAAFVGCQAAKNDKPMERTADQQKNKTNIPLAARSKPTDKADNAPEAKPPEILPDTHLAAGRLHESQGHLPRAVEQYKEAISLDPKKIEAYNRLGIVLDQLGRFKEADEAFQQALKLSPREAFLHNNLAFSYIMQQRWKEAETQLHEALDRKPDFTRAMVNLGMVLAQQERFGESLTQFEHALTKGDAYYNLGLMYQSKRKLPEAARSFKTALEQNPKLTAAQKRLDSLPPEAVKASSTVSIATADAKPVTARKIPVVQKTATESDLADATPHKSDKVQDSPVKQSEDKNDRGQLANNHAPESKHAASRKHDTKASQDRDRHAEVKESKSNSATANSVSKQPDAQAKSASHEMRPVPTPAAADITAHPAVKTTVTGIPLRDDTHGFDMIGPPVPYAAMQVPFVIPANPIQPECPGELTISELFANPFESLAADPVLPCDDVLMETAIATPITQLSDNNSDMAADFDLPTSVLNDPEFAIAVEAVASPAPRTVAEPHATALLRSIQCFEWNGSLTACWNRASALAKQVTKSPASDPHKK